jgi:hypothetical protein
VSADINAGSGIGISVYFASIDSPTAAPREMVYDVGRRVMLRDGFA